MDRQLAMGGGGEDPTEAHILPKPWYIKNNRVYFGVVITLSVLVMFFRVLDSMILGILLPQIKDEFGLSDSAIGLIGGLPFALCYTALAIPIAWLADTKLHRTSVIAVSVAFWSLMTTLSGAAAGFIMLFILRMGVGAGEAGFAPATYSLFADMFPDVWRRRAIAIVGVGASLGEFAALAAGGWSAEAFGWRITYFIIGIPGLFLALIYFLLMREPPRKTPVKTANNQFFRDMKKLMSSASFLLLFTGAALTTASGFAMLIWLPSFLGRAHGVGLAEAGFMLGTIFGIAGIVGPLLVSWLADRLSQRNRRWTLRLVALVTVIATLPMLIAFQSTQLVMVYSGLAIYSLLRSGGTILIISAAQDIAPDLKASAVAAVTTGGHLFGQLGGPLIVGAVSDSFSHLGEGESLRLGLLSMLPIVLLSALPLWLASRRVDPSPSSPDTAEPG